MNSDKLVVVPDQYKQVPLASGGVLVVAFKGNLLALSDKDREFVLWLVGQLGSYKAPIVEAVNGGDDGENND